MITECPHVVEYISDHIGLFTNLKGFSIIVFAQKQQGESHMNCSKLQPIVQDKFTIFSVLILTGIKIALNIYSRQHNKIYSSISGILINSCNISYDSIGYILYGSTTRLQVTEHEWHFVLSVLRTCNRRTLYGR